MREIFYPTGPKDLDSDVRSAQPNSYRRLLNMRYGDAETNQKNVASAIRSTVVINEPGNIPSTTFGEVEDPQTGSIFRFIYYPTIDAVGIRRFTPRTSEDPVVLAVSAQQFGYTPGVMMTHGNVVGEMLIWVYPGAPIRKINIDKAIRFYQSIGADPEGYPLIDEQTYNAAPYPPAFAPSASFFKDDSVSSNLLKSSFYQFCYRYVYDDGEVSSLSFYSEIIGITPFQDHHGEYTFSLGFLNAISVSFNTGHHKVRKIELLVRNSDSSPWGIFRVIEKKNEGYQDNEQRSITFRGDESPEIIPDDDVFNSTSMPITASCQDYTNENFLVWGNYRASNEVDPPDFSVSHVRALPQSHVESSAMEFRSVFRDFRENSFRIVMGFIVVNEVPSEGTLVKIDYLSRTILLDPNSVSNPDRDFVSVGNSYGAARSATRYSSTAKSVVLYSVTSDDVSGTVQSFAEKIRDLIEDSYREFKTRHGARMLHAPTDQNILNEEANPEVTTYGALAVAGGFWPNESAYSSDTPVIRMMERDWVTVSAAENYASFDIDNCLFVPTLKPTGVPVAIDGDAQPGYFRKRSTQSVALEPKESTIKGGTFVDVGIVYYDDVNRDSLALSSIPTKKVYIPHVSELPSADFAGYPGKNKISFQINSQPPLWAKKYGVVIRFGRRVSFMQRSILNATPAQGGIFLTLEDLSTGIKNHTISEGDKVRLIIGSIGFIPDGIQVPAQFMESSVKSVSVNAEGRQVILISENQSSFEDLLSFGSVIEISSPSVSEPDPLYYELDAIYPVQNPGTSERRHLANVQNQTDTDPAIGEVNRGNAWVKWRVMGNPTLSQARHSIVYAVEDYFYSDFIDESGSFGRGRPHGERPEFRSLVLRHSLIRGGKYFEGTQINDLFRVVASNEFPLPENQGPINRLWSRGFTLKAYQTRKITSIYINREEVFYPDGASQLVLIDRVLGTARPSNTDFGTSNPESFISDGNNIFFWDALNRVIVRDDMNGPDDISAGIKGDLNDLGDQQDMFVLGGFDRRNGEILFCFRGKFQQLNREICISYKISDQSFRSDYEYRPDVFSEIDNVLMSLIGDAVHRHDFGSSFLSIYGVQRNAIWKPIMNPNPQIDKNLIAIHVRSNFAPSIPNIEVDSGQESSISSAQFENDQGFWFSPFNGDRNTPGLTPAQGLAYGDELSGQGLVPEIIFTGDKIRAIVWSAVLEYTESHMTP